MDCLALLQGIFPNQGSNPDLLHCRQILNCLSHQGSPRILEWVAYLSSRGTSWCRNWNGVSCIAGRFFTSSAICFSEFLKPPHTNFSIHALCLRFSYQHLPPQVFLDLLNLSTSVIKHTYISQYFPPFKHSYFPKELLKKIISISKQDLWKERRFCLPDTPNATASPLPKDEAGPTCTVMPRL